MTKIIRITACILCPHVMKSAFLPDELDPEPLVAVCCGKGGKVWGKEIHPYEANARVPEWCPLEDNVYGADAEAMPKVEGSGA